MIKMRFIQPILSLFLFCHASISLWSQTTPLLGLKDTFFSYSIEDLQTLHSVLISDEQLTQEKFEQWDPIIYELTGKPRPDGLSNRIMSYLYVAQRDFALLSYQFAQQWVGNPDHLILKVLNLAYPEFHPLKPIQEDHYSSLLSTIVFRKIEERFKYEEAHLKDYPSKLGPHYWKEEPPYIGQRIGTCQPWLLTTLKYVQAVPPPDFNSIIWSYGLNQILSNQARLTPEQRQLIFYWAGQEGPESGNWFAIVNRDLQKKHLSLPDFLFIRAVLAMGYQDAMIAAFDSKYTYWVIRPRMRDPKIVEIVSCPKHPSYPSGHSVSSSAAATLLSYFFPEEKQKWQDLAIEAGNTRIWGGLHYMYDNEEGLIQGEKVGRAIIHRLSH